MGKISCWKKIDGICIEEKRCSSDSCRVDCHSSPDGFCCIDHELINRLGQVIGLQLGSPTTINDEDCMTEAQCNSSNLRYWIGLSIIRNPMSPRCALVNDIFWREVSSETDGNIVINVSTWTYVECGLTYFGDSYTFIPSGETIAADTPNHNYQVLRAVTSEADPKPSFERILLRL